MLVKHGRHDLRTAGLSRGVAFESALLEIISFLTSLSLSPIFRPPIHLHVLAGFNHPGAMPE